MTTIPSSPDPFFQEFFPAQYLEYSRFPREDTVAKAAFSIPGAGVWSFSVRNRSLVVEKGLSEETALQISLSRADFDSLFVDRTRRKLSELGRIPQDTLDALLPLFVDADRLALARSTSGSLAIQLREGQSLYEIVITPGAGSPTEPKASVRLALSDFFALLGGQSSVPKLLLRGRLTVRGAKSHALKLAGLLG